MGKAIASFLSKVGATVVKGAKVGGKLAQGAAKTGIDNAARGAALKAALKEAVVQVAVGAVVSAAFAPSLGGAGGRPVQFTADPNAPIPLVMGRMGTGGLIVAQLLSGPNAGNKFENFFGVLSFAGDAGPVEAIESFSANDNILEFDAGTHQPSGTFHLYDHVMFQWTQLGAVGDAAFTAHEYTPTDWTGNHKFTGYCGFQWVLRESPKKYPGGEPVPLWIVKGPSVYDPRQDDTYPGGAGDQRGDDPTTWIDMTAKYNPFLQALAWARGWRNNGILCLGAGLPDAGIEFADFVEGANVCDDNGWTISGMVYSNDPKFTVLEQMLRAGGGRPVTGATLGCTVQQPRTSIATLTGADIDGFPSLSTVKGWKDTFNTVTVKCLQEAQGWKMVSVGRVEVSDYVTADGSEVRTEEIEFPYVPDAAQAAQLAVYDAGESREGGPYVLPLRPYFIGLRAGDCISLVEAAFGIPTAIKLVVSRRSREPMTGTRVVTCWEETAAKHTLALAASLTPTAPGVTPPDLPVDIAIIFNSYVIGTAVLSAADVGTTATVTVAAHVRRYSDGDVDVDAGTVTGLAFATGYFIYYDDSLRDGGAVTYAATVTANDALTSSDNPARHMVGYIMTPADGAADTGGGGATPPGWNPDFPTIN